MTPPPPDWPALVAEFRARPLGRHSANLQEILNRFRADPIEGKHFLLMVAPQRRWALARFGTGTPIDWAVVPGVEFDTIEAAEWHVFRLRWQARYGFDPADTDSSGGRP